MLMMHGRRLLAGANKRATLYAHQVLSANSGTPDVHRQCSTSSSDATPATSQPQKAALLIIGAEILSGGITDVNTPWLAKLLYSRGIDLVRAEVIPDDVSDIKATLLRLRQVVGPTGMIFTSGGIGPTHDDVTYEAVAAATGTTLQVHLPTKERMQVAYDKRGIELNASRLRMATLPTPSEVLFTEGSWVPLVCVDGVYILPGIPKLFQSMIMGQQARFQGAAFCSAAVYTQMGEGDLAVALTKVAAAHPKVSIGSYPNTGTPHPISEYKVKLAFSGAGPGRSDSSRGGRQGSGPGRV
ncbi:MAG: hypothetical protein WDW38_002246 [Sanguina aurantia]